MLAMLYPAPPAGKLRIPWYPLSSHVDRSIKSGGKSMSDQGNRLYVLAP